MPGIAGPWAAVGIDNDWQVLRIDALWQRQVTVDGHSIPREILHGLHLRQFTLGQPRSYIQEKIQLSGRLVEEINPAGCSIAVSHGNVLVFVFVGGGET